MKPIKESEDSYPDGEDNDQRLFHFVALPISTIVCERQAIIGFEMTVLDS
jgi:hypothetical protein